MLQSGSELGKYRIVRTIGQGGMAFVYEAEDMELGRRVALKMLPPALAMDPERVARFMKEVRNSAALQHPNIIPIYDVGEGDGFHFYTMQLLEGGDLKERIQAGLSQPEALAVLKQVAAALGAAHAKGIVHRDVKPENVMFDAEGRAILTDLGIAKAATGGTRMTKTGMSIGTPHYMSPEQIRGLDVDGRSDIYSLGILLHEMLTGRVPYDAEETLAVSYKHVNDPIPTLPAQFLAYQPMLTAMLGKEPGHRYADCAAVIRDAERFERGERPVGGSAGAGVSTPSTATQVIPQADGVASGLATGSGASASARGGGVKAAIFGAVAALLIAAGVFWFMDQGRPVAARGGGQGGAVASATEATSPRRTTTPSRGDTWTDPVTGMEFVWVPGGCFQMGSNNGASDENQVHEVCVDGFWMGKYEVTQAEWRRVMGGNPSSFKGDRNPVEKVSWNDAQTFIRKMNTKGNGTFRLPTEAEWEYAARSGGRNEKYSGGNDVGRVAWYDGNSGNKTHRVGTKAPNGLGIYDMSGNVWEWCADVYDKYAYYKHSRNNPVSKGGGSYRVFRGGSWNGKPGGVRSAVRYRNVPSNMGSYLGFRLLRIQ